MKQKRLARNVLAYIIQLSHIGGSRVKIVNAIEFLSLKIIFVTTDREDEMLYALFWSSMFLQSAKYIYRDGLSIEGCNAVLFWDQYFTQDAVVGAQYFVQDAVVEVITSSKMPFSSTL